MGSARSSFNALRRRARFAASSSMAKAVSRLNSFFFSSRRRHTRSDRDWSSDVCSSDLGDQLLAVIAQSWKEDGRLTKPGIVATVMSNLGLERFLDGLGLEMVRTPVGDRYVLEQMLSRGYNLGGESSGHIILSDYATTGDGFVAALQVLAVVQKLRRPVSEVCHRFDPLPQILKNVRYRSGKPLDDADVQSAISAGEKRLNGHGRLLVRSSGTEPVIRVMGEGDDRIMVEEVVDHIVSALGHAAAA